MGYLLDIATAVPEYLITKDDLVGFYSNAIASSNSNSTVSNFLIKKKILIFNDKTKIVNRYSCIPDFNANNDFELFSPENYSPTVEQRMAAYKEKLMPLATDAIDKVIAQTKLKKSDFTHLITVSCTGLFAPGFEFLIAEKYNLPQVEKLAINFSGCYAALKALKNANYIAKADPEACILIVCAELSTLHFNPSQANEAILANLLFADGAAAAVVCGENSPHIIDQPVLKIEAIGSALIPKTRDQMTWDISSNAFKMYLSKQIVNSIKENIEQAVTNFLNVPLSEIDYWAIHPGGIKIVDAVKMSLNLKNEQVEDSIEVLKQYGNMSSPTILFILHRLFNKLKKNETTKTPNLFSCAFGPGLTIEMVLFSFIGKPSEKTVSNLNSAHAVNA